MGGNSKVSKIDSARAKRRELKALEEEAARLRLRMAAVRFDLKYSLDRHPYVAAGLALTAGFAVGYSPGLRQTLLKTSFTIVEGLLRAGAGAASGLAANAIPADRSG